MNQIIFQIFDVSINSSLIEWEYQLKNISKANGHWMLISPIQPPYNPNNSEWFMSYQPLSYQLTDETKKNLCRLTELANLYNVKVIVDVVWNHTSLQIYNEKTKYKYHPKNVLNADPNNMYPDELSFVWMNEILPDLNTQLQDVRNEAKIAIDTYRNCGVSGFRIDSGPYIDGEFFDFVFQSSPKNELHLYEIFLNNYSNYTDWMIARIKNDNAQVVFYYFNSLFEFVNSLNNFESNEQPIVQYFPPSIHFMTSILDHDIILNISNYNLYDLYTYFCIFLYFHQNKYILYGIYNKENSPNIFLWQRILFNWDNYFGTVEKIINAKLESPKVMGILTSKNNGQNGQFPVLECSVGRNCKMLINLSRNGQSSITSLPLNEVFPEKPYNLISLLTNLQLNEKDYNSETQQIFIPPSSFSITKNNNGYSNKTIPVVFFWYQGIDAIPEFVSNVFQEWLTFSKTNKDIQPLFYDRNIIENILSPTALEIVNLLEKNIPVPQVYAAVSDYVRWVLLRYLGGGVYLDTDTFPSQTSIYALNAFNEYDYILLGRESKYNINNAVIIVPPSRMDSLENIILALQESIIQNICLVNDQNICLPEEDIIKPYYFIKTDNKISVWILLNTGPYFLSTYLYENPDPNILILNYTWFYFSYPSTDKSNGKNMSLFQHIYSGYWNPS